MIKIIDKRKEQIMVKAPFPYFGGKSQIAATIWKLIGQPKHYMEPFFGSGAVLLLRPNYNPKEHIETICDKDGFIANVWRSIKYSPDVVAEYCDWPVNHADLSARKKELIKNEDRLLTNLITDSEWHDPKMAGYWIWAASCWIGSGLTRIGQIPHLSSPGKGVHAIGQIPHLSSSGKGVHAIGQRPHLSDSGALIPKNENIYNWMRELADRLRHVRVVCGDWVRVCGGNWQDTIGNVGLFFDPPYGAIDRDTQLYHCDSINVAADVMAWCKERGSRQNYRIVLAGYEEHIELLNYGWFTYTWQANGGYSNSGKNENKNRERECLYISPYCNVEEKQLNLF